MSVIKIGSEFLVNTQTVGSQQRQAVATLSDGKFLVSWVDGSGTGGDSDTGIKAQIFAANGTKSGSEFLVNTQTIGFQFAPTIATLADGGFVISWGDDSALGTDTSSGAIKAQAYNASGVAQGTEFLVNTTTAGNQHEPTIIALADGRFVATWGDDSGTGGDSSGSSMKAQAFNADGTKNGGEFLVNTQTAGSQTLPKIAGLSLSDSRFVITWQDFSDSSNSGVRAQIFNGDGTKDGGEFLVNTQVQNAQSAPTITALSDDRFVISWQDASGIGGDTSGSGIKAQIFNVAGAKEGGEILVNTQTTNGQTLPTITALWDGKFAVGWQDGSGIGGDASGSGIKVQVFNADGSKDGAELLVNTETANSQMTPTITALAGSNFVVTWTDGSGIGGDANPFGIKAQIFGPDVVAPAFTSATVNGSTLTLNYDEALAAGALPASSAFDVQVGGNAVTVNPVAASGSTVTLTLAAPVTSGQAVTIGYTDPSAGDDTNAIQDAAGNDAATLVATTTVTNNTPDTTPPVFTSAAVNGTSLVLTYDETLNATNVPVVGDFEVSAGGSAVTVSSVAVSGSTLTLTLASAVASGATVTVGYTDPSGGNDTNAIQDTMGNDSATNAAQAVTNNTPDTTAPVFISAAVNGNSVVLTYNEGLDAAKAPVARDFAVAADGTAVTVSSVAVSSSTVTLTLASAVASGQAVTIGYSDQTADDDANAIQDAAGNYAAALVATTTVTNNTPDTAAPVFTSAAVNGTSLILTYGEALDAVNAPVAGAFAVSAGGSAVTVSSVAVSGSVVTLTLVSAVANGASVTVGYTDPTGGNDANVIQDAAGNDAATITAEPVTNNTAAPPAPGPTPQPPVTPETPVVNEGTSGRDVLVGSAGDDTLDGGAGVDALRIAANRSDVTIVRGEDGTLTVTGASQGTDTVRNVEILRFNDRIEIVNIPEGPITRTAFLDEASYLSQNPDVAAAVARGEFANGRAHFDQFGQTEGRGTGVAFDERFYLAQNPDVAGAVQRGEIASGLDHYVRFGDDEGRNPNVLFDEAGYLSTYADVANAVRSGAFENGYEHFQIFGSKEGRDPSAYLDTEAYLDANPDVRLAGVNALDHYLNYGAREGRAIQAEEGAGWAM